MAASVWMKSWYVGTLPPRPSWRPLALTMPAVTVCSMPERVADGQDPFADLEQGRIAQLGEGEVLGLDLEEGQVGPGIEPETLAG